MWGDRIQYFSWKGPAMIIKSNCHVFGCLKACVLLLATLFVLLLNIIL